MRYLTNRKKLLPNINMFVRKHFTKVRTENGVKKIVLNDPNTRNSLSLSMIKKLDADLRETNNEKNVHCILISSEGPVFSSGHNLNELLSENQMDHDLIFESCVRLMHTIINLPMPVVAKVRGLATAAGCQLISACDIVIASENAKFATPGINIGLFCSLPGVLVSRNVPRKIASYLLFTGHSLSAIEALQAGLVSKVVSDNFIEKEVSEVLQSITEKSPLVMALGKKFFIDQFEQPLNDALRNGAKKMVENLKFEDAQIGIQSFIKKQEPVWKNK